jgi:hypothetical protein
MSEITLRNSLITAEREITTLKEANRTLQERERLWAGLYRILTKREQALKTRLADTTAKLETRSS